MKINTNLNFTINTRNGLLSKISNFFEKNIIKILIIILSLISGYYFYYYLNNHLGLAYNDARSHLDIGRRVV